MKGCGTWFSRLRGWGDLAVVIITMNISYRSSWHCPSPSPLHPFMHCILLFLFTVPPYSIIMMGLLAGCATHRNSILAAHHLEPSFHHLLYTPAATGVQEVLRPPVPMWCTASLFYLNWNCSNLKWFYYKCKWFYYKCKWYYYKYKWYCSFLFEIVLS